MVTEPNPALASARRLRAAMAMAGEWHEAPDVAGLRELAMAGMRRLLSCESGGWNEFDDGVGALVGFTSPSDSPLLANIEQLQAMVHQHPLIPPFLDEPEGPPLSFHDVLTRHELARLPLYQDFYLTHDSGFQMAFAFSVRPLVGIAVTRGRHDFSPAERDLAQRVRPHLRSAYRTVIEREEARRRLVAVSRGLERDGDAVVLLDGAGAIDHVTPAARAVLEEWFGWDGTSLPRALGGGREERRFHRPEAELGVRRIETDPPILVFSERRLTPDAARVRELGLTDRETEVLACVARGLADAEIAHELYLSPRTVAKHLQHVYEKLGVRERRAAAALLFAPPGRAEA